jgi:glycosidase
MLRVLILLSFCALPVHLQAQVDRIDPPFWWEGMPMEEVQIQLYGSELGHYRATVDYPGVELTRQIAVDSPNYLFLYLDISSSASAGQIPIRLSRGEESFTLNYELKEREDRTNKNQGFDASDVIYLMMPDRFANGNPENDTIEGMLESVDRSNPERRQGGDLAGVSQKLDYLDDLGMTAIWFTPIIENDMKPEYGAYHGYAATDLYRVDRRYGSNEEYKDLIDAAHDRGMRVIMDMIHNHIGDQHWWMKDLPTHDWVHNIDEYMQTNYQGSAVADPYASDYDMTKLVDGWFVPEMPDLNQDQPLLTDYLIVNTIWWIEYSGVDGIRMDTYLYPDKEYMAEWVEAVLSSYPDFNIVGEAWAVNPPAAAYWQYDLPGQGDGYDSKLPSITDFPWSFAVRDGMTEEFGWENGLMKVYYMLGQDHLYADAMKNVIFLDNHDMSRVYEHVGKDKDAFKIAITLLMTQRGIPQVYYGTEFMFGHEYRGGDDEAWRQTLPGGWPDDQRTVFEASGRTDEEQEAFEFIRGLANWRKGAIATHEGTMKHFIPENGTYVYFRLHEEQTVMVLVNTTEEEKRLDAKRFQEVLGSFKSAEHVLNGDRFELGSELVLPPKEASVWELTNEL